MRSIVQSLNNVFYAKYFCSFFIAILLQRNNTSKKGSELKNIFDGVLLS